MIKRIYATQTSVSWIFHTLCGVSSVLLTHCDSPENSQDVRTIDSGLVRDVGAPTDMGPSPDQPNADGSLDVATSGDGSTQSDAQPDALDASAADVSSFDPSRIPQAASYLVGIIGTGQSLSVGATSIPVLSTTQRFGNVRLRDMGIAPLYDGAGDRLSLVPLVEPIRAEVAAAGGAYPTNILGETPHSGMANELSNYALNRAAVAFASAHSVVGESGQLLSVIRRGGTGRAYASSLYEVRSITALARGDGRRYFVGAVILTHGESDTANALYGDGLLALANAYRMDLPVITGQREPIPLILSQQGSFPAGAGRSLSTQAMWRVSVDNPGVILCSGPKYQYEYSPDHVHLTATASRALGIKYAEVYARHTWDNQPWQPLEPTRIRRSSDTEITVDFNVPNPPMQWEESVALPHTTTHPTSGPPPAQWARGRGFEVEQAGRVLTISDVTIRGQSVAITMMAALAVGDFTVRYAMTQDAPGYTAGTAWGRQGQLRDSDTYAGHDQIQIQAMMTNNARRAVIAAVPTQHGVRALLRGPGFPAVGSVITGFPTAMSMDFSLPWTGPSGMATVSIQSDQRNYAVQFEMVGR